MTYLRCDDCGFLAAGGPRSLASVCPHCKTHGRVVRLTQIRRASSPTGILSERVSPQVTRARIRRSRLLSP
jgi:phage FluMu protein Com